MPTRLERLQQQLTAADLAALALIPGPSLRYLSGISFHLMERPIIGLFPAAGAPALVLPSFEVSKARTSQLEFNCFPYSEDPSSYAAACTQAYEALQLNDPSIGVEPLNMRFQEAELLRGAAPELALIDAQDVIGQLRASKDEREVAAMQRAAAVAQDALEVTLTKVELGMSERELAAELIVQLHRAGSDPDLPFSPIVASGPNSALPHATASDRKLRTGELLLIDWGARIDGYCSDLCRTFALGEIDSELAEVHALVVAANRAGRAACAPGATAAAVDEAARQVIEAAGYGSLFTHRTGHGLGLEPHEAPYIRAGNSTELKPGMAFTVEPGVYLEGRGGVRIEDNMVITEQGGASLSDMKRELQTIA